MPDLRPVLSLTVCLSLALSLGCEKENAQKQAAESAPKDTSANTTSENEGHQGRDALAKEDGPAPITPTKIGTPGEPTAEENALENLAGAVATDKPFVAAKPQARPDDGITFMSWSDTGELMLGYGDGRLAMVNVNDKQGKVEILSQDKAPVVAISPNTELAVLDTSPPRLIKRDGHSDILTFSYLDHLEGISFSPDSKSMFLASHEGPMRAWKDLGKMTDDLEGEVRLQDYVAKLQGDFRVDFGPMAESLATADGPQLAYTEPNGQIVWWDMNKPTEALYVLRLEPPIRSMALVGQHLVATNEKGDMRVSIVQQRNMRRWSMTQHAYLVAADAKSPDSFIALHADHIARHNIETGDVIWKQDMSTDGADLCGLSAKSDQNIVAVCDNQQVALYNFEDGSAIGQFQRQGDAITWQ